MGTWTSGWVMDRKVSECLDRYMEVTGQKDSSHVSIHYLFTHFSTTRHPSPDLSTQLCVQGSWEMS